MQVDEIKRKVKYILIKYLRCLIKYSGMLKYSVTIKNPIFIIGVPRSGTSIFTKLFSRHPDISEIPELPELWGNNHFINSYEDHYINPNKITKEEISLTKICLYLYYKYKGGRIFVHKNVHNSVRLEYIYYLFPDAKIIHIIRDGRAVAYSYQNEIEKDISRRRTPFGRFTKPKRWRNYINLSLIEQGAYAWNDILSQIENDIKKLCLNQSNYFEFKYENFVQNPCDIIKYIDTWINIDSSKRNWDKIPKILISSNNKWIENLDKKKYDKILPIMKERLNRYGYIE